MPYRIYSSPSNPGIVDRRAMGGALAPILAIMLVVMLATLPFVMPAGAAAAQDSSGLLDETTYESPQFGYTVSWGDTWSARQRDVTSNPGGFDVITLRNGDGTLRVAGRSDDISAEEFLQDTVDLVTRNADTSQVVAETAGDVPSVEFAVGRNHVILEAHTLSDNGAVVVITLTARESRFADALVAARETVLLDDAPIFDATSSSEETPSSTADVTAEATADEETVTPVDQVTPDPTGTPEAAGTPGDVTDGTQGEGLVENAYTSPTYGFTVDWNDDVWDAEARIADDGLNELELISATGSLYIWSGALYEGDPAACLQGESDFYENDDRSVTDWAPAEDADGNPIAGETATAAYGVFTLTYTDQEEEDAESVELVDYIECRELVPGEAVIVILATSTPDQYNDHVDDVLTITNQIVLAGEAGTTTPVASPIASPA